MHFFVVTVLSILSVTSAAPLSHNLYRRCDVLQCAIGLGPNGVSCIGAGVEGGLNPVADGACVLTALKNLATPPAECDGCAGGVLDPVNDIFGDALNSVEDAAGDAVDAVKNAFGF